MVTVNGTTAKRRRVRGAPRGFAAIARSPAFLCLSCLAGFLLAAVAVMTSSLPASEPSPDAGKLEHLEAAVAAKLGDVEARLGDVGAEAEETLKKMARNVAAGRVGDVGAAVRHRIGGLRRGDKKMKKPKNAANGEDEKKKEIEKRDPAPFKKREYDGQGHRVVPIDGEEEVATRNMHDPSEVEADDELGIPYLPPFAAIPDHEVRKAEALAGEPSVAGVMAALNDFVTDLHERNRKNSAKKVEVDDVISSYFELAEKHIKPLDDAMRGSSGYEVRDDGSIFVSLAAFREHLLAQTLVSAFKEAEHPEKIHVGVVVQNCFGLDGYQCRTGMQVYGKNAKGRDMARISDAPPDENGVEKFCTSDFGLPFCRNGQVRALYMHETDALGPTTARYMASKLWAGENYFMQMDSHLEFAPNWDTFYIDEVKAAKSYPKAVLSTYPPGFGEFGDYKGGSKGSKLCHCEFSENTVENHIIRINTSGSYKGNEDRPRQIAYIAAGFFFARGDFLTDVPFDPYMPWCFMGEEIALSMRAWTAGWDIYAPRTNMIAHQYRPGRMGLPKFWESVGRDSGRPNLNTKIQKHLVRRVKHMVGYPTDTREAIEAEGDSLALTEFENYSFGTVRTKEAYLELTKIDPVEQKCHAIAWCSQGTME